MREMIDGRFATLIGEGQQLIARLPRDEEGPEYWVESANISAYQAWIGSTANLIRLVAPRANHFAEECERLVTHDHKGGIPCVVVQKLFALLQAARTEWKLGLLRHIEFIVAAETFDDFLDHAASYHKANKKTEASVLASAVLEDTCKRIARKNNLDPSGMSLEDLVNALVTNAVFTAVQAKRVKAHAAVRNHASHAEWEAFDIRDTGELISGVRRLIEEFLS